MNCFCVCGIDWHVADVHFLTFVSLLSRLLFTQENDGSSSSTFSSKTRQPLSSWARFSRRECNARQYISFHYYLLGGLEKWEKNIDWEDDCLTSTYYFFFLFYLKWSCSTTSRYVLEGIDVGWQERNYGTRVDKKKR